MTEGEVVQGDVKPEEVQAGETAAANAGAQIETAAAEVVTEAAQAASEPAQTEAVPASPDSPEVVPVSVSVPVGPSAPVAAVPQTPGPSTKSNPHFGHYSVQEAQDMSKHAYQDRFEHKAEKILGYIQSHGKISRDETARLLFVSNNSAYLYLKRLVKEGKIKPTGRGKLVRYEAI